MAAIRPYVLNQLPQTLIPSALYFIADQTDSSRMELYLANNAGTAAKRLPNKADISQEIASALASISSIDFAETIAARDLATRTSNLLIFVLDATGDATVNSGSAFYFYRHSNLTYYKVAEFESMEITVTWAGLQGKPSSAVADIDDAVDKRHEHANMSALAALGLTLDGELTVNGVPLVLSIQLAQTSEW